MGKRIELQALLKKMVPNVYYQPPASVKMNYPAIVYSRKNIENTFANDSVYKQDHAYELIVIDRDPDSVIVDKISRLPTCSFDRHYTADNLNHDVFTLYY